MRAFAVVVFTVLTVSAPAQQETAAAREASYKKARVVESWPQLPAGFEMGEAAGIGIDSVGHVWVFHRGEQHPIMCLDADTGELLNSFGEGMFVNAHGLEIDSKDNVWVTDTLTHQVYKFSPSGELLLTVGEKGVAGLDQTHFDQPTDVVVTPSGEFYVADGYGNSRIVKFAADGKFLLSWGEPGSEPGQFNLPHGLALGRDGKVYVADRTNLRIQVFDASGEFIEQWKNEAWARPWGLEIAPDGYLYVMDGGHMSRQPPHYAHVLRMDLSGNVLASWSSYGAEQGQLSWGHDLAIGTDGAVYTVEVRNNLRVQKFMPARSPRYSADASWGTLPGGRTWGATSAVYPAADGNMWIAERCGANSCVDQDDIDPIILFSPEGEVLRSFGKGMLVWPHGIHVDYQGNVWVTDARGNGNKGHQVLKFSPQGELLMTLGRAGVAGDGKDTFNGPSDVLVAPGGDIFVVDGHGADGNNRVVKFAADGTFIKAWGKTGYGPGEFRDPHALAMDSQGRLFVGDRANSRIQIFDQDGTFLEQWTQFGRPSGIFIDINDTIYVADSESNSRRNPGWKRGIRIGNAENGQVTHFIEDPEPNPNSSGTSGAEGVAVDRMGNIYGAEVGPRRLAKYLKERL